MLGWVRLPTEGEAVRLHYRLDTADLLACREHIASRSQTRRRRALWVSLLYVLLGMVLGWSGVLDHPYRLADSRGWILAAVEVLLLGSCIAVLLWQRRSGMVAAWLENFAGDYELALSPEGVSVKSGGRRGFYSWQHVLALEETESRWLLYVRRNAAIPVPKSATADSGPAAFAEEARRLWGEHPENRGVALPPQPPEIAIGAWLRRGLGDNLLAGFRLAWWRPVSPHDFRAGVGSLILLASLEFVLYLLFDYTQALPKPNFSIFGVTGFVANLLLLLLGGLVVATLSANKASALRLVVILLSGALAVEIPYLVAYVALIRPGFEYPAWLPWTLYLAAIGWTLLTAYRTMRLLYLQPVPSAWLLASVFAFFSMAVPDYYFPHQDLFYPDYDEDSAASGAARIDVEETFYRQPQLVGQALAQVRAERPGVPDLYFVGFAGQADEKVFANEVKYVQALFDRRFDTAGRSVALVNSMETVDRLPLANAHNLEQALRGVGERMNREEDILFMYLTSHGSQDFDLSVSFWPLELNDLPAAKLKELLDRSGIRNRVVVVSACYSGGFVDALKDERTLVITAASRDRTSFGCGTESEFTYFGDAYFVQSLSHGQSFIRSFDEARDSIVAREKREGNEPSQPQIYVGGAIRPRLDALEARLRF